MVQSTASTVDDWLRAVDLKRAPILARVRDLALKHFGIETESMRYGMPACAGDAASPAFAFNSQKQYISLYVSPRVHAIFAEALSGLDAGKSCIRFRKPEQVALDLLDRMLAHTVRLGAVSC